MTILGRGDLAPRRKRRHPMRWLALIVVLAVLAGGGYVGYRHYHHTSTGRDTAQRPCVAPTPSRPSVPAARSIRLVVHNATLVTGLAAKVAHSLRQRHFTVTKVGNTLRRGAGIAVVRYAPAEAAQAKVVAAQIAGASLAPSPAQRGIELDIGPRYRRLASAAASHRAVLAAFPVATPTASPSC